MFRFLKFWFNLDWMRPAINNHALSLSNYTCKLRYAKGRNEVGSRW